MQDKYLEREIQARKQLLIDAGKEIKYNRQGIYGIYVEGQLVYVGKSKYMLHRIASHILAIDNIGKDSFQKKYRLLRYARNDGLRISFDVLEYIDGDSSDLDQAEAKWINQVNPILNKQIPHPVFYKQWTENEVIKTMTYIQFKQYLGKV